MEKILPRGRGRGAQGPAELPARHSPRAMNRFYLSGVLAAPPTIGSDADNRTIVVLLVSYVIPNSEERKRPETTMREVELPTHLAAENIVDLQAGHWIFVAGYFGHEGAVTATELHTGLPPGPDDF